MTARPEVVLVHGAWHGAWCWEPLRERLERRGITTHAAELKSGGELREDLTDFYTDAQAVRQLTDSINSPGVLAGHSYGGMVVTEASAGSANDHLGSTMAGQRSSSLPSRCLEVSPREP
jgi:pimeloyl-ACP methyl ester carboxylesterase